MNILCMLPYTVETTNANLSLIKQKLKNDGIENEIDICRHSFKKIQEGDDTITITWRKPVESTYGALNGHSRVPDLFWINAKLSQDVLIWNILPWFAGLKVYNMNNCIRKFSEFIREDVSESQIKTWVGECPTDYNSRFKYHPKATFPSKEIWRVLHITDNRNTSWKDLDTYDLIISPTLKYHDEILILSSGKVYWELSSEYIWRNGFAILESESLN